MSASAPARSCAPDGRHGALRMHVWSAADADEMGAYWARNREHLEPTQPRRDSAFWTARGQRQRIERAAADVASGRMVALLVREEGRMVAEAGLTDIVGGAFCSANLGYSVDGGRLRIGIGSWAVQAAVDIAFNELGLHRVQAGTMVRNVASQGVLLRCGFARIGVAPGYLAIAGAWEDHVLWQLVNRELAPPGG